MTLTHRCLVIPVRTAAHTPLHTPGRARDFALACSIAASALALAAFAPDARATDPPRFRLTVLPAPPDAGQVSATALDETGRVVGVITTGIFVESAYWPEPARAPLVATGEGAGFSIPYDINASGLVVGIGEEGGSAFVWLPGTDMASLPLPGPCCPSANAINDAGVIVGFAAPPSGGQLPTRWVDFEPRPLGLVAGDSSGYAMDINDIGHIVGQSGNQAAFWAGDAAQRLPFPGTVLFSIAHELNDLDEVVGEISDGGSSRAVVWRNGAPQELPSMGGTWSAARALNNSGWIVGHATLPPSPGDVGDRASLWIDDLPFDLNALTLDLPVGLRLVSANDVNDAGMIVGEAYSITDGGSRGFLLEPVSDTWTDLGHALPGFLGDPLLYGTGTLEPGTGIALALAGASAHAPTALVVGLSQLDAPFKGGVMVPLPSLLLAGLTTNASGELRLATSWPSGVPAGFDFYSQFWIADFGTPAGFAASNGLLGTTP